MNTCFAPRERNVNAQPLTKSHESFHNRIARIEHRHSKQGAARRAGARAHRRSSHVTSKPLKAATASAPQAVAKPKSMAAISYLRCWSHGFLLGGLLTLAKIVVLAPEAEAGFLGMSSEALYAGLATAYLFFFVVCLLGIAMMRRRPMLAQFSCALIGTMTVGLF